MNKLFIALIILSAAISGVYWFTKNSLVEDAAIVITEITPAPASEDEPINVISEAEELTALDQSEATYSEPTAVAKQLTASSGTYIAADEYSYQSDMREVINAGEFEDADDVSYQRDDSEVINVGEFVDADLLESTY
ncbi:hypothetical protein OAL10_09510 [Gammaproteobacteria bacterium]|nr:hypothetical protein [Gammaproteobacteria bacterium]